MSTAAPASPATRADVDPRRALTGVGLVLAAVLAALAAARFSGDDLQVYRAAGRALLDGINPYLEPPPGTHITFSYTPFSTLAFLPLALVPKAVGMFALTVAGLVCLGVATARVVRVLWPDADAAWAARTVGVTCVAALLSEPVTETLGLGQVNLLLLGLIVLDLLRGRPSRWQGVPLGIATAFKLTPGIFVLYLFVTRRYRAAATAAATFAGTVALGFAAMPRGSWSYWVTGVGADPAHIGGINYVPNQSVLGSITRAVGYDSARPWWLATAAVVVPLGLWAARRLHDRWGDVAGLVTAAFVATLVSPIAWSHHWSWFAVAALVVFRRAQLTGRRWPVVLVVAWAVPFYVGPFWLLPESAWRLDHHPAGQLLLGSAYTLLGAVALAVAVTVAITSRGGAAARPTPAPNHHER